MTKDEAQQAIPRPPRRAAPVIVNDANGKALATIDIGYDWREFDRYLQRLHALLGLFPNGDKAINLFTGHLDNQELITQLETRAKIPGQDGQDGEDGYTYPPIKGDCGADGRSGQPGMDGENSEDFLMAPPGIGTDVLKIYFDAFYGGIGSAHTQGTDTALGSPFVSGGVSNYYLAAAVADDGTQALPTVTANYPAHGFIHVCTTTAIVESAEFEYGSDGNVQIIRGTANVVVNADTDGKVCLGTAASQNPLTVKNRLGGVRQVMITLCYK